MGDRNTLIKQTLWGTYRTTPTLPDDEKFRQDKYL